MTKGTHFETKVLWFYNAQSDRSPPPPRVCPIGTKFWPSLVFENLKNWALWFYNPQSDRSQSPVFPNGTSFWPSLAFENFEN